MKLFYIESELWSINKSVLTTQTRRGSQDLEEGSRISYYLIILTLKILLGRISYLSCTCLAEVALELVLFSLSLVQKKQHRQSKASYHLQFVLYEQKTLS